MELRAPVEPSASAGSPLHLGCAGPTSIPILHLHLLQRCNLACAHCYSESSPKADAALALEDALGAVELASGLGYTHVAISGGEPLLSPHLEAVISRARELDQHVSVVTNGIQAANPAQTKRLAGVNSVCVSLDGIGATHDAMRRRPGAYESALRALTALRDADLQCGVSCGVSGHSLDQMESVVAAAREAGATFLNFHAIEATGRALMVEHGCILDKADQAVLYIASHVIAQAVAGSCIVHCDLVHKAYAAERPGLLYVGAEQTREQARDSTALDLGVLVVEPTGRLSPVCYGFDRKLSLGTLRQAIDSDGDSLATALPAVTRALRAAGTALLTELDADDGWLVFNPSAELARAAAQMQRHAST